MDEHNKTPADLHTAIVRSGHKFGGSAIYRFVNENDPPKNINRKSLAAILDGLALLLGRKVEISEIMKLERDSDERQAA